MESLITYLIRSVLLSGLLTGYYVLALRGRRMHVFNRFYLLSSLVLALVLPLVRIPWYPWATGGHGMVERVLVGAAPVAAAAEKGGIIFWSRLGLGVSLVVSVVLLAISIGKVGAIFALKRRSACTPMDGYELVETEAPGTPFSFFRNLFWRRGMDRDDSVTHSMLAHELAHIRGRHSWDILGMQAVLVLFWMNPFFWYIRKELTLVLEFSADAASGAEGDPELLARMLLQAYAGGGHYPTLVNAFFHSPIKRRIVMITNNNRSRRAWMRKALVAPVLVAAVLFFACSKEQPAQIDKVPPPPPPQPQIIADAGDAAKIKLDSIQVRLINLSPSAIKVVKFDRLTSGQIDSLKLNMKVMSDSLMKVYYVGSSDNRIEVKGK